MSYRPPRRKPLPPKTGRHLTRMLGIRLDEATFAAVHRLAEAEGRTAGDVGRSLLLDGLRRAAEEDGPRPPAPPPRARRGLR